MTEDEIYSNSNVLLLAGSETTATMLSGTTYHLTKNPEVLAQLTQEVRNAFVSANEINALSVDRLPYLCAVVEEGLRIFPPVPTVLPRRTPAEGCVIGGTYIPGEASKKSFCGHGSLANIAPTSRRQLVSGSSLCIGHANSSRTQTPSALNGGWETLVSVSTRGMPFNHFPQGRAIASASGEYLCMQMSPLLIPYLVWHIWKCD